MAIYGFEQATVARIAKETGYTTGMIAHYYESKQEIVLASLRLILRRIEERLSNHSDEPEGLLAVLAEALPLDAQRRTKCAFWTAFWGQVSTDRRLKRINAWVHREYLRLFERCLATHWPQWAAWPENLRHTTLRSVVTFINGITASAVASQSEWPAERQMEQLKLQLDLLHRHASEVVGSDLEHLRRNSSGRVTRRVAAI